MLVRATCPFQPPALIPSPSQSRHYPWRISLEQALWIPRWLLISVPLSRLDRCPQAALCAPPASLHEAFGALHDVFPKIVSTFFTPSCASNILKSTKVPAILAVSDDACCCSNSSLSVATICWPLPVNIALRTFKKTFLAPLVASTLLPLDGTFVSRFWSVPRFKRRHFTYQN